MSGGRFPNHAELPTEARQDRNRNCQEGIDKSFDMWEIPKLLDGEDMANPKLDQNSMMTYISYFRNLDPDKLYKVSLSRPFRFFCSSAHNFLRRGIGSASEAAR